MKTRVAPIKQDFVLKARKEGLDDQNQPVERIYASGGEPCRDVLRRANPGEELILASYCPFSISGPYKEYGPIFILANKNLQEKNLTMKPSTVGSDTSYLGNQFVLRAYSSDERIVDAKIVNSENYQEMLTDFFLLPEVSFVLIRFAAYGCYALRLERESTN